MLYYCVIFVILNLKKKKKKSSIYFHQPSQGISTNCYLILGLRDKAAPPTRQQINKFPPKRVKNLATPSSFFIFLFLPHPQESSALSQRQCSSIAGQMFPEHVVRSFLDPEYRPFPRARREFGTSIAPCRLVRLWLPFKSGECTVISLDDH